MHEIKKLELGDTDVEVIMEQSLVKVAYRDDPQMVTLTFGQVFMLASIVADELAEEKRDG